MTTCPKELDHSVYYSRDKILSLLHIYWKMGKKENAINRIKVIKSLSKFTKIKLVQIKKSQSPKSVELSIQ